MRPVVNRLLSFLLGAALTVGGFVAVIDGLRVAADRPTWILDDDRLYAEGTTTYLGDNVVLVTCILIALAGLLLLALQLWRRPPARIPLRAPDQDPGPGWADDADPGAQQWWLDRRPGERMLTEVTTRRDDVAAARVRLRRRRRHWRALVQVTPPTPLVAADVTDGVADAVEHELANLAAGGVDVRTRLTRARPQK